MVAMKVVSGMAGANPERGIIKIKLWKIKL